jgi:hypothetical protein
MFRARGDSRIEAWETASTIVARSGSPDEIEIIALVSVRLTSTGSEGDASNCTPEDWTDFNGAGCTACGYEGEVKDFEPQGVIIGIFGK